MFFLTGDAFEAAIAGCNNGQVAAINRGVIRKLADCDQLSPEEITLTFGDDVDPKDLWMFDSLQFEQKEFIDTINPCPQSILLPEHLIATP